MGFSPCRRLKGESHGCMRLGRSGRTCSRLRSNGREGKLEITGLGRFYGLESLTFYNMLPEMGPPDTTRWEYPWPDRSSETETAEFISAIHEERRPIGDAAEAVRSMSVIERIYQGDSR